MKRTLALLLFLPVFVCAQPPKMKSKKYQSLLWEISGNGMKKPSYLFGTMHVSSKLAFHLADSFYLGIRNADVVALETNPESWQEDMSKYDLSESDYPSYLRQFGGRQGDYLRQSTLKFFKYDKRIERALYSNPSTINNLLYRSYGNESSDFEEDTYLDMYIYQVGKKWGKKVAGVEHYAESMRLMTEAYRDAAKDRVRIDRSYDNGEGFTSNRLQEAYRSGNLDWLDSINRYNSFSAAFDEKFLYRRNEIQAANIDSILRSGQSLFVGVGAAHLPGQRGVIEILRAAGYRLRPIKMGMRDSHHKNQVEKLRVPVVFQTQTAPDNFYKVDVPGKFYKFSESVNMEQLQYADMANGSYYMVTRFMTNSWMWGQSTARVNRIVDSLLYENIPGRIISKTSIVKNGFPGIDITNRTRRGDLQRYNVFVTPFEIIIFKMSGTGDYVTQGEEAKKFFGSIHLNAYDSPTVTWKKYSPPMAGFSVDMPHTPYTGNDGSWVYDAVDKNTQEHFRVIRTDITNTSFAGEDTFDLALMDESFKSSEFIDTQTTRRFLTWKGYPAMDASYRDKYGNTYLVRYIIQGQHYYSLVTRGKQESIRMRQFLNSFEIKPYIYGSPREYVDTLAKFSATFPYTPEVKEKLAMPRSMYGSSDDDPYDFSVTIGDVEQTTIVNDTTGEKIMVSYFKLPRYGFYTDSLLFEKKSISLSDDTTWIVRKDNRFRKPDGTFVRDVAVTDTGSSRVIHSRTIMRNDVTYHLLYQSDTLSKPSAFVSGFFDTFTPTDTSTRTKIFSNRNALFFEDLTGTDSTLRKKALKAISVITFDSMDAPRLEKAIASLDWKEKKYLDSKKALIGALGNISSQGATNYLKRLYQVTADTMDLQLTVLSALLQQKTAYSFATFRDLVVPDPPVLALDNASQLYSINRIVTAFDNNSGGLKSGLTDSLKLTRTILPDLLPLIDLVDYRVFLMNILRSMIDSGLVKPKDYEKYSSRFQLEAKQMLRRHVIDAKQKEINKAEEEKNDKKADEYSYYANEDDDDLFASEMNLYATLLLPFWESNKTIEPLFKQMLATNSKQLKYEILLLLVRNKKPVADSLLRFFAASDSYRYKLYKDLQELDKPGLFPAAHNNHIDLARSKALSMFSGNKPDSVVYVDRLLVQPDSRKGYVYFFRYKAKKNDVTWRLLSVGLVPEDPKHFEFDEAVTKGALREEEFEEDNYDFSVVGKYIKWKEDEPPLAQLQKIYKRVLYSHKKSGREFFGNDDDDAVVDMNAYIED